MAYKEFLDLVEAAAESIKVDRRVIPDSKKWTEDEVIYYTQQIMIFLANKRDGGLDINHVLDQRIEVKYEKGADHSYKMRKDFKNSIVTEEGEDCNIATNQ